MHYLCTMQTRAEDIHYSQICQGRESTQWEHKKMESLRFLAVMLSWILSGTVGITCNILHYTNITYSYLAVPLYVLT